MEDIIVKSLDESGLLIKGISEAIKNEAKQPGFLYNACAQLTRELKRIKKFKATGDSRHICQNELYKACFQHEMAYGDFKDLNRWIIFD